MDPHHEKPAGDHVLQTPIWLVVIRGFQVFLSLIILALCGRLMHDAYLEEEGFSLAVVSRTPNSTPSSHPIPTPN